MTGLLIVLAALAGLFFGKLAGVVADRIPARSPLLKGWDACPNCGADAAWVDNIPLLGFALHRGRCQSCGVRCSIRYPLMELAAAVLFGLAAWKFHLHLETIVYAAFFWVLIVLSAIDLEHKLLPDRVVFPALAAGAAGLTVAALVGGYPDALVHAAIGAAIFGGFLFVVAFINPAGMGGGDVKLSFLLGMFLGYLDSWGIVMVGMFLSFVLGGVIGLVAMVVTGGGRKMQLPFGPFLALGTTIAVFLGHSVLTAYLG
ncbi:MAG: A24 family peptidase [Actinomycetota bacterium]|nr:A24 family peptidase [Actinomycetota bacterium]